MTREPGHYYIQTAVEPDKWQPVFHNEMGWWFVGSLWPAKDSHLAEIGSRVPSREEWEAARDLAKTLTGGVADLQRHIKIAIDEDPVRIPPGILAVVGSMHKAIKEAKEDASN